VTRNTSTVFKSKKYVVLRGLLDAATTSFYHEVAVSKAHAGTLAPGDRQVPGTPAAHGDPLMERLLEELRPAVERASGLELEPTYSYFRVYKRGDVLPPHRDRKACEVSISLCLGQRPARPWPLWIEGPDGVAAIRLKPGDALLYRGVECWHWRDAYDGEHVAQVFLHYVERGGRHAKRRYDGRGALYKKVKAR
jgi:hypothetical protein